MFSGTVPKQKTLERNMASIPSTTPYVFNSVKKTTYRLPQALMEKALRLPWSSMLAVAVNGENISRYVNLHTNPRQQRNGIILLQFVSV